MPEHELTTRQSNDVLHAIRAAKMRPEDFVWDKTDSAVTPARQFYDSYEPLVVPVLLHKPTNFAFAFDLEGERSHHAVFHPGTEGPTEQINTVVWSNQLAHVRQWLQLVKDEYEAPDLWAEVGREKELLAPPDDEGNAPFTAHEQEQIARQLNELKELLRARYQLEGEPLEELESRLGYLERASLRVGRIDWGQILVSQLVALVARAVIPQDALHDAAGFLVHSLGHLFGGGLPQLPL